MKLMFLALVLGMAGCSQKSPHRFEVMRPGGDPAAGRPVPTVLFDHETSDILWVLPDGGVYNKGPLPASGQK